MLIWLTKIYLILNIYISAFSLQHPSLSSLLLPFPTAPSLLSDFSKNINIWSLLSKIEFASQPQIDQKWQKSAFVLD